jgi:methylated-DNA-[protein]-cysteine S-methyltransferase
LIYYFSAATTIGNITIYAVANTVTRLYFGEYIATGATRAKTEIIAAAFAQLEEYLTESRKTFDFDLEYAGTDFQMAAWRQLRKIPYGKTKSYKEIADAIGNPKSSIAVGQACHKNPIPIFIPCHRVIGTNGSLTGYGGGLALKKKLLMMEGTAAQLRIR